MSLQFVAASCFRCLSSIEIEPDPRLNLVYGPNAGGKTSLLESLFYLGRGRSFRLAGNRELIQTGTTGFTVFGTTTSIGQSPHRLGVEVQIGQRRIRVDGGPGTGADLAQLLPVQVIDPEVHELVQGPPELRRRFLDWGVFHVKHDFLQAWRAYEQALRQRNAALRQNERDELIELWDDSLAEHGENVHEYRRLFLDKFLPLFSSIIDENISFPVKCSYKSGWSSNANLRLALRDSLVRDRAMGSTQVGPHRADLLLQVDERRARHRVSRGQQKMLAAALVIAQVRFVAAHIAATPVLLVDDPAAELDSNNRERLFNLLQELPAQLFVTALDAGDLPWAHGGAQFRVEHGKVVSLL